MIMRRDKETGEERWTAREAVRENGEGEKEEKVEHKEKTREIAVAIGGPTIKNQLTSQLLCESQPIKCA